MPFYYRLCYRIDSMLSLVSSLVQIVFLMNCSSEELLINPLVGVGKGRGQH